MAIVQISRITNRKGLQENLPQLAGAELGWSIDERRLFIGNGTLQEGAPVIGNTEILTEFSDITALSNYTYSDIVVGYAAQTGPTPSAPVVRTVQAKLDDFASVRDFGAVGDGVTDDTAAINRALYQLYCRELNTEIRRALYFPAGTYKVTETIVIPTYAKLIGEGAHCTFIYLDGSSDISTLNAYVARYGDSLQQTGANIGNNSATAPRNIEISAMTFQTADLTDVFLVEDATQCWFDSVEFVGPLTAADITVATDDLAGVRFANTTTTTCDDITFDKCRFSGLTYGIDTTASIQGVTVSNSKLDTLYQGIVLDGGGPTGFRALHNIFDAIYAEGIVYDEVSTNISAYNAFYDVAESLSGTPTHSIIRFGYDDNVSVNDMFERTNAENDIFPRVSITGSVQTTVASATASQQQLGRYTRVIGQTMTLTDNSTAAVCTVKAANVSAFRVDYTIVRSNTIRTGTMTVATEAGANPLSYNDDWQENASTGITLSASQSTGTVTVSYTASSTGSNGTITFSITHLA